MWSTPRPGRGHSDLSWIGLGIPDELGNRLCWKRWVDDQHAWRARDARDRRHLVNQIEAKLLVERRVDGVGDRNEEERVAIRRRSYNRLGGDIAARANPIFYKDLPAEPLL